jgi:phage tail sheath protein FI
MPFQLSPGVNVTEIDLTTVIPAVATTDAAIAGVFKWGPVDKPTLVVSESELANVYGKPDSDNAETFFTAASFLAYSNRLHVSRAHHSTGEARRVQAWATNGADHLVVSNNVSTGVKATEAVSQVIAGIGDNVTVTGVDISDITETVTDTASDLAAITGVFTVSGSLDLKNNEPVTIDSANTLPNGLANTTTYFIQSATATTFTLSATQGGSSITNYSDVGDGALTVTRSGHTRITLSENYTGTTESAYFEFHDDKYSFNAVANNAALDDDALLSQHIVKNEEHYDIGGQTYDTSVKFVAKYPGAVGNSLKVSVCDNATQYNSTVTLDSGIAIAITVGNKTGTVTGADASAINTFMADFAVGDLLKVGTVENGIQYLEIAELPTAVSTSLTVTFKQNLTTAENVSLTAGETIERYWGHWGLVEAAPGQSTYQLEQGNTTAQDEIHVIVIDEDGDVSGVPGTILEVWQRLSRASDAKGEDGGDIYYKNVINQSSNWIWFANTIDGAAERTAALTASSASGNSPTTMSFSFGRDIAPEGSSSIQGDVMRAYDKFKSAEDYDISLVLAGKASGGSRGEQMANYIIDNICERRKDCVAFVSPEKNDVVANATDITQDVVDFRNVLRSTSYAVLDSGYKYMYDKYNDIYRWIPINGDTAGLCAATDDARDPWYSPAGFNRGNIKNVVKLAWNPKKAERDILYKNGVNPIVNFPGQGIVMFGDKTLLSKPSAFDRINVRRLFIVLEKAIATAAKFTLFEFNDEFTRASFVNLVTPFLRDVQGRRGVTDFAVICDETNNTGEVIDRNEFVGDIYIKPARSINFIQLNFVAVRTGVEFSEVIGQF